MFFWCCFLSKLSSIWKLKFRKTKVHKVQILHLLSRFWCRNHLSPNNPAPSPRLLGCKKQRCWWYLMRDSWCLITTDINLRLSFLHQDYRSFKVRCHCDLVITQPPPFNVLLSLDLSSIPIFSLHLSSGSHYILIKDLKQWQFFISNEDLSKMCTKTKMYPEFTLILVFFSVNVNDIEWYFIIQKFGVCNMLWN